MSDSILVLITKAPTHMLAEYALRYVQAALKTKQNIKVFFYADGAVVANNLMWQTVDQKNLTKDWQLLAAEHELPLKVCVSTALARGVTDTANAKRHGLLIQDTPANNLAAGFELVGLTELMLMMDNSKLVQF